MLWTKLVPDPLDTHLVAIICINKYNDDVTSISIISDSIVSISRCNCSLQMHSSLAKESHHFIDVERNKFKNSSKF